MKSTPKGLRLHIGLFGRRNVGKSSLLNGITRQQVSIVSDVAGTTSLRERESAEATMAQKYRSRPPLAMG